jgi:hypothetical protein
LLREDLEEEDDCWEELDALCSKQMNNNLLSVKPESEAEAELDDEF